ncbi:MAG: hypothetical protein INR67_04470 [Jatrophihabitans endophyticus]|nr:hypothetical protein [Jatrophihabitans endophyticus]
MPDRPAAPPVGDLAVGHARGEPREVGRRREADHRTHERVDRHAARAYGSAAAYGRTCVRRDRPGRRPRPPARRRRQARDARRRHTAAGPRPGRGGRGADRGVRRPGARDGPAGRVVPRGPARRRTGGRDRRGAAGDLGGHGARAGRRPALRRPRGPGAAVRSDARGRRVRPRRCDRAGEPSRRRLASPGPDRRARRPRRPHRRTDAGPRRRPTARHRRRHRRLGARLRHLGRPRGRPHRLREGSDVSDDDLNRLDAWVADLAAELGVDAAAVDRTLLLDVARDAAHQVARPAAPLTTFLVGLAAGRNGGDAAAVRAAAERAQRLATGR